MRILDESMWNEGPVRKADGHAGFEPHERLLSLLKRRETHTRQVQQIYTPKIAIKHRNLLSQGIKKIRGRAHEEEPENFNGVGYLTVHDAAKVASGE